MTYAEKVGRMLIADEGGFATKYFEAIGLTEEKDKDEVRNIVRYLTADGSDGAVRGASLLAVAAAYMALGPALATAVDGQRRSARAVMAEIGEPGDTRTMDETAPLTEGLDRLMTALMAARRGDRA